MDGEAFDRDDDRGDTQIFPRHGHGADLGAGGHADIGRPDPDHPDWGRVNPDLVSQDRPVAAEPAGLVPMARRSTAHAAGRNGGSEGFDPPSGYDPLGVVSRRPGYAVELHAGSRGETQTREPRAAPGPGRWLELSRSRRRSWRDVGLGEVEETDAGDGQRRAMPLWQELPLLLVVAFCLAVLIRTFLLQAFYIPSGSMEQTLLVGDRVLVNKIVYDVRQPERGEVIVFRGTDSWVPENPAPTDSGLVSRISRTVGDLVGVSQPGEKDFIKRVIAVPGDRVSCCDPAGRIYVNGQGLDEPYIPVNSALDATPNPKACGSRRFDEVLVPPGQLFVMGDHRIVSQDSRCQGTIPIDKVIGRAFVIVWPSGRWGTLSVPQTFENVPGPVAIKAPGAVSVTSGVGAGAITLPLLASLVVTVRSGRKRRWRRRTLRR